MRTSLMVTEPPEAEPVSPTVVKRHCRIDHAADDELLLGYINTARIMAEGYLSRALLTQTLLWTVRPESSLHPERSRFWSALELPRAPVQSIVSVTVVDNLGNSTTIAPAELPIVPPASLIGYLADLDLEPARLTIGEMTPLGGNQIVRFAHLQHIQVEMIAGYDKPAAVPRNIVHAIMMGAAFLYEHRGDEGGEMSASFYHLLDLSRLQFFGG